VLSFICNFIRKSLSIEIDNFSQYICNSTINNISYFTKSAFVQCRKKIKPKVFKHLSSIIVNEFYNDNELAVKLWKGFRLLAVEGSRLTLPKTQELKSIYGTTNNQHKEGVVQGRVSVLYDILNNYIVDGILAPLSKGEPVLAVEHLNHTRIKDLIIYDRGYPSFNLVYEHEKRKINFLFRVKEGFSNTVRTFVESKKRSQIVVIKPTKNKNYSNKEYDKNSTIKVRLIYVTLKDGSKEILMTSLLDSKKFSHDIFKTLYFKRWGIETFYDELKNKINVENFSGYSNQVIQQDFNVAIFVSNIQTLIISELEEEINKKSKGKKYKYKINTNLSYGFLKNRILTLLMNEKEMEKVNTELKCLFKKHIEPIRPNRSNPRNSGKYRTRYKPIITKNHKNAI